MVAGIYMPSLALHALRVTAGTSVDEGGSNTSFVGTDFGLTAINEHSTQASSTSVLYRAMGTGLTGFNGALLLNGVDGSGSWPFSGSALGPAQGHATTTKVVAPSSSETGFNALRKAQGHANARLPPPL